MCTARVTCINSLVNIIIVIYYKYTAQILILFYNNFLRNLLERKKEINNFIKESCDSHSLTQNKNKHKQ